MSDEHEQAAVEEPVGDAPSVHVEEPVEDLVDEPAPEPEVAEVAEVASDEGERTGHPAVDEVLRSLEAFAGQPVDEHVAAFEDAHERLRRALSTAGDDTA
jgi:hypothetical protein